MKATKDFRAVPPGEIYPVKFAKGDDVPDDLEDIARELGALPAKKAAKAK